MNTPWGQSDHQIKYGEGITFYGTPSHGGFKVAKKMNLLIPEYMRNEDGWYEEDCEYAQVMIIFPHRFEAKHVQGAIDSFRNWAWQAYEKHYEVELKTGESYTKDKVIFHKKHKNDFIVTSAMASTGSDMVKVRALNHTTEEAKWFMVPSAEYKMDFVIDLEKHEEVEAGF